MTLLSAPCFFFFQKTFFQHPLNVYPCNLCRCSTVQEHKKGEHIIFSVCYKYKGAAVEGCRQDVITGMKISASLIHRRRIINWGKGQRCVLREGSKKKIKNVNFFQKGGEGSTPKFTFQKIYFLNFFC